MAGLLLLVIALSIFIWLQTREHLPEKIRIAAGSKGGQYFQVASAMGKILTARTGVPVKIIATNGSVDNHRLLRAGDVDLAIIQEGAISFAGLSVLVPLFQEPILLLVAAKSPARTLTEIPLTGLVLGPADSGMWKSAAPILAHYGKPLPQGPLANKYFNVLGREPGALATIVTSGILNPDLRNLVANTKCRLLALDGAEALALLHPEFHKVTLPRGLLCGNPPIPTRPVDTVATTATLCGGAGISKTLITTTLAAIYADNLQDSIPCLLSAQKAEKWAGAPLHQTSRSYFSPYSGLGVLANFMEFVSGAKELLFAFGAGFYLLVRWWHHVKRRERQGEVQKLKDRLDQFLEKTVAIEKAQMQERNREKLEDYLAQVTRIKLQALEELAHEELRGDNMFAIFLMQCANLIRKIQTKILCAGK